MNNAHAAHDVIITLRALYNIDTVDDKRDPQAYRIIWDALCAAYQRGQRDGEDYEHQRMQPVRHEMGG